MNSKIYESVLKKYDHEIKVQREIINTIREQTHQKDEQFNPDLFEYNQNILKEYSEKSWFLFNYDLEQLEKGNTK